MADLKIDLLVMMTVSRSQSKKLMANLNKKHYTFTIIDSTSGIFHEATVLLVLGLNHTRRDELIKLVKKYCQPYRKFVPVQMRTYGELSNLPVIETVEGGFTFYSLAVEYFEQI